jgi:tripartite-type tricarboxylate transporter receptor subunit TctC
MTERHKTWFSRCMLALLACALSGPGLTQDWPTRSLTMVVAFPARGSDDILARILAPHMSDFLGQAVIVENVGGSGGLVGTSRVAKAPPDGYELMLGTSATHGLSQVLYRNPPYSSTGDFTPVALVAEQPFVLIARKGLPGRLPDFIAVAKASEAPLQFGSAGTGSATHLVCALFGAAAGVKAKHVPYNGGAPALNDLLAGRIDYFCPVVTIAIPQIENQRVQGVAMLTKNRSRVLPDLPSAQEQGLGGFAANTWFGVFLPKSAPGPIVRKLHSAAVAAMEDPTVQAKLKDIGAELVAPERRTPEYLRDFLRSDIEKWAAAIKTADLPVQ